MDKPVQTPALEAIEQCWLETFDGLPFVANVAWRDSGADSLNSTLFVLRLEQRLGMAIPLDSFGPATTPEELAEFLEARRSGEAAREARRGPPVFLLPGMLGDEPRLVAFRQAFPDPGAFEVLDLPDIERTARELGSIAATAAILLEQIDRRQPTGPVRLFGYSVGGIIAHELAAQLVAAGREVALLGLLDPFLRIRANRPLRVEGAARAPLIAGGGGIGGLSREKIGFGLPLVTGDLERARRHLNSVANGLPIETLYWRRQRLIGRLRWRALRHWQPRPLDVPAILISSDEAEEHFDVSDWLRLLPRATRLHVGGTHLGLFEPEPLARMVPALSEALEAQP